VSRWSSNRVALNSEGQARGRIPNGRGKYRGSNCTGILNTRVHEAYMEE
jgi:hypothetical protein